MHTHKIAVVIPCYKVKKHIKEVLKAIPKVIGKIYVVDDYCPEGSGQFIASFNKDPRVSIIYHSKNKGVGGAVISGYKQALADKQSIIVKLDGDGQMDPVFIPNLIKPILEEQADYTKGNRFFTLESLSSMPNIRKFGNACLSFINKISSGYWDIMDPTNGFTAIHQTALKLLPLNKLENRYFFESDMLFRLGTVRAVVKDIPMQSIYKNEDSNLQINQTIMSFPKLYCKSFFKRVFYNYFLRDFNRASIELVLGISFILFGTIWGAAQWAQSIHQMTEASTGTVMLAVLPIIIGFQMLLDAIKFDADNVPQKPLQKLSLNNWLNLK